LEDCRAAEAALQPVGLDSPTSVGGLSGPPALADSSRAIEDFVLKAGLRPPTWPLTHLGRTLISCCVGEEREISRPTRYFIIDCVDWR